jgi:hypothetical protein
MFSNSSGVVTSAVARRSGPGWRLVSEPAGTSNATLASALEVGDRQAEAGQLRLVDVDAEDLVAVAIGLRRRRRRRRRPAGRRSGPRPAASCPRSTCVSEVTARRITASELASALTMRGASASSGSWLVTRPTASRMSLAADRQIDRIGKLQRHPALAELRGRGNRSFRPLTRAKRPPR